MNYIKTTFLQVKRNKKIFQNFTYITLFQIVSLLLPLITYPYLSRVLGTELYGLVITAQILASYCSILINFGFPSVSARHIAIHRNNKERLSEIVSSILYIQLFLWVISFAVYVIVIQIIPLYRTHFLLFLYSFFLTFLDLLFPQYYFQGIEKMKYITIISITFQSIFVLLIFFIIKSKDDYLFVPLLHSIGYLIGGGIAMYIIFFRHKLRLKPFKYTIVAYYVKDALPIFSTDVINTIKTKFNYLFLGSMVGMSEVVIYDIGDKLTNIIQKPIIIIRTVIFPKMSRDKNDSQFKKIGYGITLLVILMVIITNVFLQPIVHFILGKDVDLFPIRLYIISAIILGVSIYIAQCLLVARGYNRYLLYSILVTTLAYILAFVVLYLTNRLNTVTVFVGLTVMTYLVELIYRLYVANKIMKGKI